MEKSRKHVGARQREYPSSWAAGLAGQWEARATRSRGALVSKGCSQHAKEPFHGRTLELGLHMDLWPCSSPCGRLALLSLVQAGHTAGWSRGKGQGVR